MRQLAETDLIYMSYECEVLALKLVKRSRKHTIYNFKCQFVYHIHTVLVHSLYSLIVHIYITLNLSVNSKMLRN